MIDIFSVRDSERQDFGNPARGRGFSKLRSAMRWSYKKLEPFRLTRKKLIDTYTGGSYGDGGESGSVPINLMELAVSIYQRQLASHTPAVMCETDAFALRPVAKELELAVNYVIDKRLDLGAVLNEWVVDAMFAMGIIKVGEVGPEDPRPRGFRSGGIHVFADTIGLEDWCHDMSARKYEEVDYAGHMYDAILDEVLENPDYDKLAKENLYSSVRNRSFSGGEFADPSNERPETLTATDSFSQDEYIDKVVLWEMWVPQDNLILTFATGQDDRPLLERPWSGPEEGPFHILGFSPVPGNIMPVAPAMLWEDLMDLVNRLFLKIGDQADRQRTILAGQNRTAAAMEQITRTADGETVLTDIDPNLIKEFNFGGVDGGLMATFMQFKDMFSYVAGNIDSLGGLGAATDTIGQDRMLKTSASERLADYQQRVLKATTKVVRDIAWYLWHNDNIELPLSKPIIPTVTRDFTWNKFSKDGEFFDYNFRITPHSLQAKSPQDKLMVLMSTVNQTILPMLPVMEAQGVQFDVFKFLEHVARLSNVAEINDLVTNVQGQNMNEQEVVDPAKSPVTQRSYTRQSIPGSATPTGRSQQAIDQFQQLAQQQASARNNGNGNRGMMSRPGRPPAATM